ncbi:hypothetical protein [Billgrantia zhangzhouensis]|uniref:hypothetical protein n=1 Tax=Billgrantia zhangzhouensis TaxID=2733481 RepID=UPI001F21FB79|nr:hypothetical protein [Halomonas zhangzhouensis]
MSRSDIGSYGLVLETVSRVRACFLEQSAIAVTGRELNISDIEALEAPAQPSAPTTPA